MDILQNLAYPQSPTNIMLLKYLLFLTLLLLLPYLSVLISTTLFSIMHFAKGKKNNQREHLLFSNDLIDLFTVNKGMSFTLGVVPLISLAFIFAQLLLNSGLNLTSHLIFTLILFVAALIYVYTYKYSFTLKNIFNLVDVDNLTDQQAVKEFEELKTSNSRILSKSGIIGFILLLIVAYIILGVLQVVLDLSKWTEETSFFNILFSTNTILYFLFYLSFSFAITCAAIVFKYFKSDHKEYSVEYIDYVKNFSLKTGLIFTIIQPFLYVLTILSTPTSSMSFSLFIAVILILLLMLVINIMFYLMYKESSTHLGGSAVLVFLFLTSLLIYKDQLAFDTVSQKQIISLNKEYESFASNIKSEAGIEEVVVIDGEDIYNAKCIACHRFDTKLVGPPYNEVLPKYDGKKDDLVGFILKPVKVNAAYPDMPSQGLKPKEAEAIADYIIKIYKGE